MQTKLALLLALAASASANVNYMAAMNLARDGGAANLFPRQTLDSKCLSAAQQIASSVPTPPPAILSELTEHPQTDPCHFSVPASLSKDFSSYESQLESFASKNKDLLSDCTGLSQFNTVTECGKTVTDGATAATKTSAAATTTSAGAGGASGASSASGATAATAAGQTTSTKNAGARETGMAMAAVAAAGFAYAAM